MAAADPRTLAAAFKAQAQRTACGKLFCKRVQTGGKWNAHQEAGRRDQAHGNQRLQRQRPSNAKFAHRRGEKCQRGNGDGHADQDSAQPPVFARPRRSTGGSNSCPGRSKSAWKKRSPLMHTWDGPERVQISGSSATWIKMYPAPIQTKYSRNPRTPVSRPATARRSNNGRKRQNDDDGEQADPHALQTTAAARD